MKKFTELEKRLKNLVVEMGGDLWEDMLNNTKPPSRLPEEQELLDLVYRDAKALAGYMPDLMALMRKHVAADLDDEQRQALLGILGYLNLTTKVLFMILVIPRYHDHQDLITTLNAYRQTRLFVIKYLQ